MVERAGDVERDGQEREQRTGRVEIEGMWTNRADYRRKGAGGEKTRCASSWGMLTFIKPPEILVQAHGGPET